MLDMVHYNDVIMSAMASQITGVTTIYSTVYSDADQRKLQSSATLAFVMGIHQWPVTPHKWPVTRKMFPFDDVFMRYGPGYRSEPHPTCFEVLCDDATQKRIWVKVPDLWLTWLFHKFQASAQLIRHSLEYWYFARSLFPWYVKYIW